jgi:branched-chain amino acid transport system substrate-binding protein
MSDDSITSRRNYLKTAGAGVAAAGLAGCTGNGGGGGGGGDGDGGSDGDGGDGGGGDTDTTSGGNGGSAPDEILIGGNHPLSGFLSRAGNAMANGGRLAVKHINEGGVVPGFEDGGIPALDGAELAFEAKDNKGEQELGGEVEQELIDAGAKVVTGCYSSPVTLAATQVAERSQIPHVVDVSVADGILQGRDAQYTWRVSPNADRFSQNYAEFMPNLARANDKTYDTASIVYLNNAFGQAIRKHLNNYLPENDVEVVMEDAFEFGQSSMDTEATKVKQTDADAFIFVGYAGGGIRMMNSFQNVNYRPPLMTGCSTPTYTSINAVREIGKFANGGFGNNYDFNYNLDWTDKIFADYRTEFGERLSVIHAVMTYTSVLTIANAIEQAGSADVDDINSALENVQLSEHPGAMGPVEFGDDHENKNGMAPMLNVQNIDPKVVWPKEYAETDPIFE